MGNWTTVHIEGTCDPDDLPALRGAVNVAADDWEGFHCLCNTGGICGLGNWPEVVIDRVGNLAERDFSTDDVAEQVAALAKIAPSLSLKIHVGGEYESKECVATVTCENGSVTVGDPEIERVPEIPAAQMHANLSRAIGFA